MEGNHKKFLVLAPIVMIVAAFLISMIIYPVTKASPKDIPIALVSLDQGITTPAGTVNVGEMMKANITSKTGNMIKWKMLNDEQAVNKGFANQDFYAAIVIPKDFTAREMAAKAGKGTAAPVTVTIDQGQNPSMATMIETSLSKMTASAGITADIQYLHPVGANMGNGSAHLYTFILTWITALIGAIILFRYSLKPGLNRKQLLGNRMIQAVWAVVATCILGFIIAFIAKSVLGFDIPFMKTVLFVFIAGFCLMMMIIGVLNWTGMKGIAIFILLICFGLIASNLPYEVLPGFWQHWIYPWIPTRFASLGLREIYYMGSGVWNHGTAVLSCIGAGGLVLLLLSALKRGKPAAAESGTDAPATDQAM